MKTSNPVQLVILIVAVLLGYNALQTFPYLIWLLYRWAEDGLTLADTFQNMAINFLFIVFYMIGAVILIKKSVYFSEKISEVAHLPFNTNIAVKKADIFQITIITMGGYIILTRLPKLLVKIYLAIKEKNDSEAYDGPNYILPGDTILEYIIIISLALILIAYSKQITKYLVGANEDNTDIEEIGSTPAEK